MFQLPLFGLEHNYWDRAKFGYEDPDHPGTYRTGEVLFVAASSGDALGAPVRAAGTGTVVYAQDFGGDFGNTVIVQYKTSAGVVFASSTYARLGAIEASVGSTIKAGEIIGTLGSGGPDGTDAQVFYSLYAGDLTSPGVTFSADLQAAGYLDPSDYRPYDWPDGVAAYGRDSGVDIDDVGLSGIHGADDDNYLAGRGGNDLLAGYWGNDILDGGTGDDTMLGGTGNDVYIVDSGRDVVEEGMTRGSSEDAGGTDTVRSAVGWTLGNFVEKLVLIDTANNGAGNAINNVIMGNESANILQGLGGNDQLNGGAGDDTVDGGQGDDILGGGAGIDVLFGGEGSDAYFFDTALSAENVDRLVGFDAAVDKIYLDHTVFTQLGPEGTLSSDAFDTTGNPSLSPHIHFDVAAQKLYFAPGSSSPEIQIASFSGIVGTLTHDNFLVV